VSAQFLPTISEIFTLSEPALGSQVIGSASLPAEYQWGAAIAALSQLLQQTHPSSDTPSVPETHNSQLKGVVLACPSPVLSDAGLTLELPSWIFTTQPHTLALQLPPQGYSPTTNLQDTARIIPLLPGDPVTAEQFCLVLTAHFSLVMVLATTKKESKFLFSFTPEVVQSAWEALQTRALLTQPVQAEELEPLVQRFAPIEPHYKTVVQFSSLMLQSLARLPQPAASADAADPVPAVSLAARLPLSSSESSGDTAKLFPLGKSLGVQTTTSEQSQGKRSLESLSDFDTSSDVELLQAIAHEVRTPLATINTLTRLLLKRPDLPAEVVKRLEVIHRECAEQIDRFSLIFRAAEIETSQPQRSSVQLASISLAQVLQQSIPQWQKRAARRNLKLHVSLPQQMPAVVSEPTMLDQALTGLIDRFTRSLPAGSQIHIQVALAGEQLKLQLQSQCHSAEDQPEVNSKTPVLKSVGQLLMLQPETGSVSLSLPVTKNLFQALGGKLTVRRRSQQDEVLTIFLPLGRDSSIYQS